LARATALEGPGRPGGEAKPIQQLTPEDEAHAGAARGRKKRQAHPQSAAISGPDKGIRGASGDLRRHIATCRPNQFLLWPAARRKNTGCSWSPVWSWLIGLGSDFRTRRNAACARLMCIIERSSCGRWKCVTAASPARFPTAEKAQPGPIRNPRPRHPFAGGRHPSVFSEGDRVSAGQTNRHPSEAMQDGSPDHRAPPDATVEAGLAVSATAQVEGWGLAGGARLNADHRRRRRGGGVISRVPARLGYPADPTDRVGASRCSTIGDACAAGSDPGCRCWIFTQAFGVRWAWEALSRGAASALFVESDHRARRTVLGHANIATLGLTGRATACVAGSWAAVLATGAAGARSTWCWPTPPYTSRDRRGARRFDGP